MPQGKRQLPFDDGLGLGAFLGPCNSLLAGQVGNIDGSMGSGCSLRYVWLRASSAVIRLAGSYVKNLSQVKKRVDYLQKSK